RLRAALPANYALEVIAEETPSFPVAGAGAAIGDAARRAAAAGRYGFTATRSADGAARVVGLVADEASRAQVGAYARSRLRGLEFEADLSIGTDAAPPGWERALFAGLEAMSSLTEGELAVDPKAIYLQGRVTRGAAAAAAVLPLEKTPEGYLTFSRVTVVETPPDLGALREEDRLDAGACVAELNRWLEESPIGFEPGSFVIDLAQDAETDTLDRVAAILRRCPEARFEVGGHTDSEGDAEGNRLLSRRRATAVRLSLVARGIAKIRLTSAGYGADTPIADNSTPQGRERNRRIEFRLLDPT
ncbi:MAG: OmpA family protein, partial [Pseudomonadota bacterium]